MKTPLDGYKTYIVGAAVLAVGLYLNYTGQLEAKELWAWLLAAAGLGSVRHAIARKP